MKVLSIEFYKLRRKYVFLIITIFLLIEIIWGFIATTMSISRDHENASWENLILMLSTLNGLFLPILSAICVSRICDMEHKGNTWKLLLTVSVKRGQLYVAKYICACIVMLWIILLQVFSITIFGIINNFDQSIPLSMLAQFFIGTFLTSMVIIALQQWVSMAVKNQAFALSLGMVGGFLGMTAALFPLGIRRFFIWSYYTSLSPVKQNFVNEQMQFIIQDFSTLLPLMITLIITGIVIFLAGSSHISRQEV